MTVFPHGSYFPYYKKENMILSFGKTRKNNNIPILIIKVCDLKKRRKIGRKEMIKLNGHIQC